MPTKIMSQKLIFLCLALALIACSCAITLAQPPGKTLKNPSSANAKSVDTFVSLEAGFSIDLPKSFNSYEGVKPVASISKGGSSFSWQMPEVFFIIRYEDLLPGLDNRKILSAAADGFVNNITDKGAKIVHNESGSFSGIEGREIQCVFASGSNSIVRYLLVEDRVYTLQTIWRGDNDPAKAKKVLDSLKIVKSAEIIARKLEEATPPALPQSPNFKPRVSDAKKQGLRGAVKSVTETKEYLDGTGSSEGILTDEISEYDAYGNLIKNISFDYRGNPMYVKVYGVIDEKRVSKDGKFLDYEYNPPPMMIAPGSGPKAAEKPRDPRYTESYQEKYDDQGRISEQFRYNNRSELTSRTVYRYESKSLYRIRFDEKGKENWKVREVYDENSNLIETTNFSTSTTYPDNTVLKYIYLSFDAKGNWIRREVTGVTSKYGGGTNPVRKIEYRAITYF